MNKWLLNLSMLLQFYFFKYNFQKPSKQKLILFKILIMITFCSIKSSDNMQYTHLHVHNTNFRQNWTQHRFLHPIIWDQVILIIIGEHPLDDLYKSISLKLSSNMSYLFSWFVSAGRVLVLDHCLTWLRVNNASVGFYGIVSACSDP